MDDRMKCLNPWDPQSKRQYQIDGVYCALNAGNGAGGQAHGVCYQNAVVYDGSSVTSPKNWNNPKFGDPCYSLHTDSRNYVVIALEGNGARPSHQGTGYSEEGKMFTLNTIEKHAVCYALDQQGGKSNCGYAKETMMTLCSDSHGTPHAVCYSIQGNCVDREVKQCGSGIAKDVSFTLNTQDKHAVCYDSRGNGDGKTVATLTGDHQNRITDYTTIIIDHSRRHSYQPLETVPTLEAHMGTGGGNVPLVLTEKKHEKD